MLAVASAKHVAGVSECVVCEIVWIEIRADDTVFALIYDASPVTVKAKQDVVGLRVIHTFHS